VIVTLQLVYRTNDRPALYELHVTPLSLSISGNGVLSHMAVVWLITPLFTRQPNTTYAKCRYNMHTSNCALQYVYELKSINALVVCNVY